MAVRVYEVEKFSTLLRMGESARGVRRGVASGGRDSGDTQDFRQQQRKVPQVVGVCPILGRPDAEEEGADAEQSCVQMRSTGQRRRLLREAP